MTTGILQNEIGERIASSQDERSAHFSIGY